LYRARGRIRRGYGLWPFRLNLLCLESFLVLIFRKIYVSGACEQFPPTNFRSGIFAGPGPLVG
jgi:hypothetical protein